jgi:hypothetical protein
MCDETHQPISPHRKERPQMIWLVSMQEQPITKIGLLTKTRWLSAP